MDIETFEKNIRKMARRATAEGDALYRRMDPRARQAGHTDEEAEAYYAAAKSLFMAADKLQVYILQRDA